jgi:CRP-like cAMP-binding protein
MSLVETSRPPNKNRILAALSPEDYERLAPHLEQVEMPHGRILYKANDIIEHVYFPTNSMISLLSQTSDGSSVEVGLTGFEGMTGLSVVLGVERSPHIAMVQIHDGAMRLKTAVLREEFKRGGRLQAVLLRFTQSLMLQISQVAACNRLHMVEERLARWLLMSHDRCICDDLPLTQEFISLMLGVRRAGVTTAAIALHAEGYINYKRGHISITDREGLETFSCDCYRIIKAEFDRLNSGTENAGGGVRS